MCVEVFGQRLYCVFLVVFQPNRHNVTAFQAHLAVPVLVFEALSRRSDPLLHVGLTSGPLGYRLF